MSLLPPFHSRITAIIVHGDSVTFYLADGTFQTFTQEQLEIEQLEQWYAKAMKGGHDEPTNPI